MGKNLRILIIITLLSQVAFNNIINDSKHSVTDSTDTTYKILPLGFYNNSLGWVIGGFAGIQGFAQKTTLAKVGGIASSNGSYYSYLQIEELQNPLLLRMYFRPDIYIGKLGEVEEYIGSPNKNGVRPGSNESKKSDYMVLKGKDNWMEFNFKFLLPFGDGKEVVTSNPVFEKGILISGETGGKSWNPFLSGRSFLESKLIYRSMTLENDRLHTQMNTAAIEFALSHENMDYYYNPTIGSYKRVSYTKQWDWFGSKTVADVYKIDLRWYLSLYDKNSDELPRVLAVNFYTADTPSWNDYDVVNGQKVYHRPEMFAGANLGGVKHLRAYKDFRFYDRSLIYYSAEIRQNLPWNFFDYWSVTRKIGAEFFQLVAFIDLGRVAPEWSITTLHKDMKYSVGAGLRFFMKGMIVRLDVANGQEGTLTQMFIDHPF